MTSRMRFNMFSVGAWLDSPQYLPADGLEVSPDFPRVGPAGGRVPPDVESSIARVRGDGQLLEAAVQKQMSTVLAHDFSDVRIHTGPEADELNRQLGATAFTTGRNIFFAQGAYVPETPAGAELLAHELVHVLQQRSVVGDASGMVVPPADGVLEQEAIALAGHATGGGVPLRLNACLRCPPGTAVLQRSMAVQCKTGIQYVDPGGIYRDVMCLDAVLFWLWRVSTDQQDGAFDKYVDWKGGKATGKLIADLVRKHGKFHSSWGGIKLSEGDIVVFTSSKADNDNPEHACVHHNGELYGQHQDQGAISGCDDGSGHCSHPVGSINWSFGGRSVKSGNNKCEVYSVGETVAIKWFNKL